MPALRICRLARQADVSRVAPAPSAGRGPYRLRRAGQLASCRGPLLTMRPGLARGTLAPGRPRAICTPRSGIGCCRVPEPSPLRGADLGRRARSGHAEEVAMADAASVGRRLLCKRNLGVERVTRISRRHGCGLPLASGTTALQGCRGFSAGDADGCWLHRESAGAATPGRCRPGLAVPIAIQPCSARVY